MPLGFAGSPELTPAQIESIRSLLSKKKFKEMADLKAALPHGMCFMPMSSSFCSLVDANGKLRPYSATVSVCRLSEDRDLGGVEDNHTGRDVIQSWFIRDLPIHK